MLSTGEWTVKKLLLVLVLCGLSGAQSIRHTVHVTRKGFQPAEINARPSDTIIFDMHDSMVNENWSIVEANLTSRWSRCLQLKEFDDDALWKCHQSNCTTAKTVRSNIVYGLRENSQSRCSHEDSLLFIKVYQGSYDHFGENDDDYATPPSEKTPCTKFYDIFNNNEHYYRSYHANNQYNRFHDADVNACGLSTGYNTGIRQHAIQFVVGALPKDHQWRMINEYVALILGVGVLLMYCFFLWKVDQVQRQLDMTEEVIHQLVVAEYGFPVSSKVLAATKFVVLDAYSTV